MAIQSEAFSAASPGQRPVRVREQPDFALSPRSRTQLQGNYLYAAIPAKRAEEDGNDVFICYPWTSPSLKSSPAII
ncbi:hypothetical protein PISMIDRAFT_682766 [Pisolithus microcarpus 441]|uniref:Uncharacterized protein n=1 Tax=Pisolithus microcarpus 441 TaxID=765257 RepID=A0A0C9ZIP1_9AGAM|nr:hypothetical protein PISMIDRAFT_682766 [Pisolithus microcarpus 441]